MLFSLTLVLSEVQGYSLFPNTFHKISTPEWRKDFSMWSTYRQTNYPSISVLAVRAHYNHLVCGYLNQHFPLHWVRCTTAEDQVIFCSPLRSRDLLPCDFFLWPCVKDSFYCHYHRICLSHKHESSLPSEKLIITCCSGMGGKWLLAWRLTALI